MPNEYEIEIVETNLIDGGIEIFARAWKNGVQLGFGKDGTIDIERFRVFNPPVLVDDVLGDIIIPASTDPQTGSVIPERRLREDAEEAILQSLTQTIATVGIEGTNILAGSRGNTTDTFYSGGGDGKLRNNNASFATASQATAAASVDNTGSSYVWFGDSGGTKYIDRAFFPFDTSAIADTDTIDSATFSVWNNKDASNSVTGDNYSWNIYGQSQASDTTLAVADYDTYDTTEFSTAKNTATFVAGATGYYNYTLNASGLAAISKTSYSKFALINTNDYRLGNTAPTQPQNLYVFFSESAGTTNDPKLVVVHSAAAPTTNSNFFAFM